ncbi:hypothetical protein [Bradyrhizobium sp. CB1015]|uniref:hypothetical protein n=1 Tax=Bradyrhizobium sp. CB1015 TaxID=2976822 RepID=UPI0021A9F791|nr:hypothetical protein [Bradyrhizobium sp. CB1015]UWU94289.1 hypothetical protein N2604_10785 [Bradyrhizobium sp. CB1015]
MPAIFDLLYREYCRARLAEMRKHLLIVRQNPEDLEADYARADQVVGRTGHAARDLLRDAELKRTAQSTSFRL